MTPTTPHPRGGRLRDLNTARTADRAAMDAELLTRLQRRYDQGVAVGISTNLGCPKQHDP